MDGLEEVDWNVQFIDVGMEDTVYETDARALVGVLIGQLDADFPEATLERC